MPRAIYVLFGWLCVALGVIGAFLPVMPTTVFLILAAICFGRGSPRAHAWLTGHSWLGPPIRKWEETGAISRPAKAWACGGMAASFVVSWALGAPGIVLAIEAVALISAAAFVLTRPD